LHHSGWIKIDFEQTLLVLLFALMQKEAKKSGLGKMAKNYCVQ
jgi:hypothetical protein